jgi:23S rRNA (guanosine2251-2'-O)-methyltransferase
MNYQNRKKPDFKREEEKENIVTGRNPVMEALRSGRTVDKILVAKGEREGSLLKIVAMAKERGIPVMDAERSRIETLSGGAGHQGVLAFVTPFTYSTVEEILELAQERNEPPCLILLDGVTDPHNVGAILRTACCCGVHGVILPKHNSCGMTPTLIKSAAGATEYIKVARVTNMTDTIEELKKHNIWIYGTDGAAPADIYQTNLTGACAFVLGDEGRGMSRLVREHCDFLVKIPMKGPLNSLNVSVAGAVILYESLRQRGLKNE